MGALNKMALIRLTLVCAAASAFAPRPNLGVTAVIRRAPPVQAAVMMGTAKNGIFSPIVRLAKRIVGKERFLSFRGRVIGAHTKVIQAFVDTSPRRSAAWRWRSSSNLRTSMDG